MKKILSMFFVTAAFALGTTSCSDFLEEDNKTGETADLAYNTISGIDGLITSAYDYTHGWWGKEPSLGLAEMGSDLFYFGYDNKQKSLLKYDISAEALGNNVADNPCLDQYWEMFYAGIDVCNNALKYVPTCTVIDDNKKAAYTADALFLRALYYSQMVAMWGPIPYNSEPIGAINNNPVRIPEAEVYANILNDLKKAMENYKQANVMTPKAATAAGRAYYYSAEALYARVALYAASWLGASSVNGFGNLYTEALNAATDVINNSGAKFYDRYQDTWNMNNEEATVNTENLFAVHYTNDLSAGRDNCVPYRFSDGGTGQYNSLITRTGYSRQGGSASLLMFPSLWNNGCDDIGPNGQTDKSVFFRMAAGKTTIKSKMTGENVECGKYYSPYGRGFTRYLPSLYFWQLLESVKLIASPMSCRRILRSIRRCLSRSSRTTMRHTRKTETTSTVVVSPFSIASSTVTLLRVRLSRPRLRTSIVCSSRSVVTSLFTPLAIPQQLCQLRVVRPSLTSMVTTAIRVRRSKDAVLIHVSRNSSMTSTTPAILLMT